jgi:hypothetical protein
MTDAISSELLEFLQDILAKRVASRDIAASEQHITAVLTGATDDTVLTAIVQPAVQWLSGRPESWSKTVEMVALYVDRKMPTLNRLRPLSSVLLKELLATNRELKTAFLGELRAWGTIRSLEKLFPNLELDANEASVLLARCAASAGGSCEPGSHTSNNTMGSCSSECCAGCCPELVYSELDLEAISTAGPRTPCCRDRKVSRSLDRIPT